MCPAADAAPSFLFLPELGTLPSRFPLTGDAARYLTRVVRAREGERVHASDGAGLVALLRVERAGPEPLLVVESSRVCPPAPPARLLCGAPEGERGDWLVEKLAELGITELRLVDCARARWPERGREARWERLAEAALRQSRSAWKMAIRPPVPLERALEGLAAGPRWLADAAGAPLATPGTAADAPLAGAVGPSPGFSDDERGVLVAAGFSPVRLAPARLRAETAAVALAAHWAAWREPRPPA